MRDSGDIVYTVDIIILTDRGIPLIKRRWPPFQGQWAIPGGKMDKEDAIKALGGLYREDFFRHDKLLEKVLRYAAIREAKEEIVDGEIEILEKIGVYDKPGRDPRGDYVSHAYIAKFVSGRLRAASDAEGFEYFIKIPENMAFDHADILMDSKALEKYKNEVI